MSLSGFVFRMVWHVLPASWRLRIAGLHQRLLEEAQASTPRCETLVYADSAYWRERFPQARALPESRSTTCSVILTCKNESASIVSFLASLEQQSLPPTELVICDGGSSDDTTDRIKRWHSERSLPWTLVLLSRPEAGIAQGRNEAIRKARSEYIVCTDAGVILDSKWLERLRAAFEGESEVDVVAGWYRMQSVHWLHRALRRFIVPADEALLAETLLPSARSLAFTKTAWKRCGGFPEFLSFAAEDTYFGMSLRSLSYRWAFVPEAEVRWLPPRKGVWRMLYRYAKGDGEIGLGTSYYLSLVLDCLRIAFNLLLASLFAATALMSGLHVFTAASILCLCAALYRYIQRLVAYAPWHQLREQRTSRIARLAALHVLLSAQVWGVVSGWRARAALRRRRLAAKRVVCIESENPLRFPSREHERLEGLLAQYDFVLVLYSSAPAGTTMLLHPRVEQRAITQFDAQAWCEAHAIEPESLHYSLDAREPQYRGNVA